MKLYDFINALIIFMSDGLQGSTAVRHAFENGSKSFLES